MDNKTHLQLKEQLLENISVNKNQSRGKNKIIRETKTRRKIGGKKIKKTKKR